MHQPNDNKEFKARFLFLVFANHSVGMLVNKVFP